MIINGTTYDDRTPEQVARVLERARMNNIRIRLWHGDTDTGRAWADEHDVIGYVGRSMGPTNVPILLYNKASAGGGSILDHCIVRIDSTAGATLYSHPKFSAGNWDLKEFPKEDGTFGTVLTLDGHTYGEFNSPSRALDHMHFMQGMRYKK